MTTGPRLGEMMEALGATARRNAGIATGAVCGLTIGNSLLDCFASQQLSNLIGSIIGFVAQVVVTRMATQRMVPEPLPPRVGGFLLLSLLTTAGVLAGLVCAVLPGLYLAARWLAAGPIMLTEREGVISAMRRSWRITAPVALPLCGLLLMLWASTCVVVFGGALLMNLSEDIPHGATELVIQEVAYLATFTALVGSWLAAVSTFGLLSARADTPSAPLV